MKTSRIRRIFIDFFASRGHQFVAARELVARIGAIAAEKPSTTACRVDDEARDNLAKNIAVAPGRCIIEVLARAAERPTVPWASPASS